jgi:hypothetical protein
MKNSKRDWLKMNDTPSEKLCCFTKSENTYRTAGNAALSIRFVVFARLLSS